jgi:diaminohydroxyphosphoribosylaminopyrimidine deaminase/5-amino-6-(5-phosphoribosylamino)uracil reductase
MGADPLLDGITPSRLATHAGASRQPLRVVLDTRLTTPLTSQLVSGNLPGATLVVGVDDGTADWASRRAALTRPGVEVAPVGRGADGRPDPGAVLDLLGARGVTTLLLEGGATIHEAFFRAGLVDRVAAVLAPVVIGGGPSAVGTAATGPDHLAGASRLQDRSVTLVGEDVLVTGWLRRPAWLDDAAPV